MDINSLNDPRRLADREIDILFKDAAGKEFHFKILRELIDFLNTEAEFWRSFNSLFERKLSSETEYSTDFYEIKSLKLVAKTGEYFTDMNMKFNEEIFSINPDLNVAIELIRQKVESNFLKYWFYSEHTFCKRGIEILKELGVRAANNFFAVFTEESNFTSLDTVSGFKGAMLAYEFQLQDKNSFTSRVNLEEESVSELKESILKSRNMLYDDFKELKDKLRNDVKDELESDQEQFRIWLEKVENLESTYKEKLRLEPAATYWTKKAKEYKESGNRWSKFLTGFIVVGFLVFGVLFYTWVSSQSTAISLDSLQGVVLFITVLSIYAFAIKALSKMVFSSYHLQRDAEEREQLTHLYLALTHEKDDFDADARSIVLQALFSRADTGLISGDSSPTMPGLHEIINASSNR